MRRYEGKAAIITGAGQGIGRAIALRLAAEGGRIGVLGRTRAKIEETARLVEADGGEAIALHADVRDESAVTAAVATTLDAFDRLDVLVNNAAYLAKGSIAETNPVDWDEELAICLTGPYLCARAALRPMVEQGSGVILNISSATGMLALGNPAYSAAKAGLAHFTKSLCVEYGPRGIRANTITLGTVRTENPIWVTRLEKDPRVFETLARWYPVGRIGKPEEVAAAVAFLGADEASFVSGANLCVDGGLTAGMPVMIDELTLESGD